MSIEQITNSAEIGSDLVTTAASPTAIAATRLAAAEIALLVAAGALMDVGTDECMRHATEARGAARMLRTWELAMRRLAAKGE